MRLPNWFKIVWWVALIGISTYFMQRRWHAFEEGSGSSTDIVILLVWVSLLLTPLFQEIDLFGVRLKQQIESLRSDFRSQISTLKSEIQNSIAVNTQFNPQIVMPPPDSQLPTIKQEIQDILKEMGVATTATAAREVDVPNDTQFLFSIRYGMEKELRRIAKQQQIPATDRMATFRLVRALADNGVITQRLSDAILEVSRTVAPAIHGEQPTGAQVAFVRDVGPQLLASLRET